jgi:hypothetical protein
LSEHEPTQLELFADRPKADRLGPTLDQIREKFGKESIFRAQKSSAKITPSLSKKQGDD